VPKSLFIALIDSWLSLFIVIDNNLDEAEDAVFYFFFETERF
jgi:hypothetical protein